MKLDPIGSNMTEVEIGDASGRISVLFSYKTPVACFHPDHGWLRTSKRWSMTTSRHINKWLNGVKAEERPQEFFDNLTAQS